MDILSCTSSQWNEKESQYLELLQNHEIWEQIPLLNVNELHNLQDSKLVRFRGMIQDMHGPEYYLEQFEVTNTQTAETTSKNAKYMDILPCEPHETVNEERFSSNASERHTFVAISIPAVNQWVQKLEEDKYKLPSAVPSTSTQIKRPVEDMEIEQTEPESNNVSNKRQCTEIPRQEPVSLVSQEHLLNFPIPDSTGKVCHLKVYKNHELLKLNSVHEFVGFLSVNPTVANHEEMNDLEFQTHNPPPSLIPRIHCVSFRQLNHNNPLVTHEKVDGNKMQLIKKELLILLTQLMCGDELAAEFLIYNLISEVYLRREFNALGKFSLNISNIPKLENVDYVQELYKFVELFTTKSHYLSMSLENMNELAFVPKKDNDSNRLTSSILQLSANTHLVVDETKLMPGKLNEAGVTGVRALSNAIKNQKTSYNFTYYELEFDCDIPFLILSEGKSMLPSDIHVILEPEEMHLQTFNEILQAAKHFLKPELLNDIRIYLTSARLVQYELSDSVQELVQNEFVNLRRKRNISGDDLHNLLVLARLVCISQGKNTLDEECWRKACVLDDKRKERIKKRNP